MLHLDSFFFFVCVSITDFWFAVTMRFLYSSLYIYTRQFKISDLLILNTLGQVGLWALLCGVAASCWLFGPGHKAEPQGAQG